MAVSDGTVSNLEVLFRLPSYFEDPKANYQKRKRRDTDRQTDRQTDGQTVIEEGGKNLTHIRTRRTPFRGYDMIASPHITSHHITLAVFLYLFYHAPGVDLNVVIHYITFSANLDYQRYLLGVNIRSSQINWLAGEATTYVCSCAMSEILSIFRCHGVPAG